MLQRRPSVHLDITTRTSLTPSPLPSPPSSATSKSPVEERQLMSPISNRPSHYRKPSRHSVSSSSRASETPSTNNNVPEEERMFIYEPDASETKYMHHFDKLDGQLDVGPISTSDHKLRNHPSGEMKTWEYLLPDHLWPPLPEKAKSVDATIYIRWGREIGYVQITNILKAMLIPSVKMSEFLKGYEHHIVRIRGGQIGMQGSWIPYDIARKVCVQKCYKIRKYLAPIFGSEFVNECVPQATQQVQRRRPVGRRPKTPPRVVVKRPSDEFDDESDDEYIHKTPIKRIKLAPCASGSVAPPALPSDLDVGFLSRYSTEEICAMLSAARELMRMRQCPFNGPPKNEWPMSGDPRMGGYIYINGQRYIWDGADELKLKPEAPAAITATPAPTTTVLPSIRELTPSKFTHSLPSMPRYPITPSPHQSPFTPAPIDFHSPRSTLSKNLISPPMSVRESFPGHNRDREYSINSNDECRTPIRIAYTGPLFPTPQPEI